MSRSKRFLESRATRSLLGLVLRGYRSLQAAGTLFRHDPRLLALLRTRRPVIFACWHQDFLYTVGYLSRWNARRPTVVLASASRDGGLAAAAAEAMGFRSPIRGSSARGGTSALRRLERVAREGRRSIVVVCDGPRPPARRLQPGVLYLSQKTGLPVCFVRLSYRPAKTLERTWARFTLPAPLVRCAVGFDGPWVVPPTEDRAAFEELRAGAERRMNALTGQTDGRVEAWVREASNRSRP